MRRFYQPSRSSASSRGTVAPIASVNREQRFGSVLDPFSRKCFSNRDLGIDESVDPNTREDHRSSSSYMDRGFENNLDFTMNQQNFQLSDFGIEAKPSHANDRCNGASSRYRVANVQVQQAQMRPGRLGPGPGASSTLQVGCNRSRIVSNGSVLTCNSQRRSPNQSSIGQLQKVGDRFQASSPNNLSGTGPMLQPSVSSVPSPGYWNHYSGQESGVNDNYYTRDNDASTKREFVASESIRFLDLGVQCLGLLRSGS